MVLRLPDSWSNWNLKMLVFEERGKPEYPEKNLSEQRREPTTNLTHIWRRHRDLNPGHIDGRRVLPPLRHPCSPRELKSFTAISIYSRQFQIAHGNFNFFTATLTAFFASLTTCQLRRPTVATKSQNAKSKVDI